MGHHLQPIHIMREERRGGEEGRLSKLQGSDSSEDSRGEAGDRPPWRREEEDGDTEECLECDKPSQRGQLRTKKKRRD